MGLWTDIESVFLALVIFLATMKFLRILKFNKHISIVTKSISIAKGPLISYSVCFVVVLLGFAILGNMTFGSAAYMFSTFPKAIVNSFEMILGKGKESFLDSSDVINIYETLLNWSKVNIERILVSKFCCLKFMDRANGEVHKIAKRRKSISNFLMRT